VVETGLAGRHVLVFGATGALGAAVAAAFADLGAVVRGADKQLPGADRRLAGLQYESVDALDDDALRVFFDADQAPWAVINTIGGAAPPPYFPARCCALGPGWR